MKSYIGIDPGMKGGIAVIHPEGAEAWRYPGDITAAADLLRELHIKHAIKLACIESVHSMPGQGVSSMFKFGQNFGAWLGMLSAYGIPHTTVTPHKWQKATLDAGTGDTKARSLNMARRLFPDVDMRYKADDGKADALMMKETGGRKMITASISGKMAFDARVIETKSGTPMTTARLACGDDDGNTIWIDLLTFNHNAEWLARAVKGDRVAAMGVLKMNCWQDKSSGEKKQVLQLVADNVIVPTAKPRNTAQNRQGTANA